MWYKLDTKTVNGVEVREPTARQFAALKESLDRDDFNGVYSILSDLTDLPSVGYVTALASVMELATNNPLKISNDDDDNEGPPIDWSVILLQEADIVARRYGISVLDVLDKYSWRQIKYIVWLDVNQNMRDMRTRVALAGGKVDKEMKPLRLKIDDGYGTTGMTDKEKAAYWRKRRKQ